MAHLNASSCARGARQLIHNSSSIHRKSISSHSQRYCFSGEWASPSSGTWDFCGAIPCNKGDPRCRQYAVLRVFFVYLGGVLSCDELFHDKCTLFFSAADFICLKPCALRILSVCLTVYLCRYPQSSKLFSIFPILSIISSQDVNHK